MSFNIDFNFFASYKIIAFTAFLALLYVAFTFMLAYAWKLNLEALSESNIKFFPASIIYIKANIAKYLPGNVMHYVGRNAFSKNLGLSQAQVALSTVMEIVLLSFSCGIWSFVLAKDDLFKAIKEFIGRVNAKLIVIIIVITASLLVIAGIMLYKKRHGFFMAFSKIHWAKVIKTCILAFLIYSIVLFNLAVVLAFIISWSTPLTLYSFRFIIASFLVSWICGFLIPGAPGGIGVREAMLTLMLGNICGMDTVLLAAVVQRFIFVLGDILAWLAVIFIEKHKKSNTNAQN